MSRLAGYLTNQQPQNLHVTLVCMIATSCRLTLQAYYTPAGLHGVKKACGLPPSMQQLSRLACMSLQVHRVKVQMLVIGYLAC